MSQQTEKEESKRPADVTTVPTMIDRRTCERVVPLKVLVMGQSRTGTSSIRSALYKLGYHDVYHFASTIESPRDIEMWMDAFNGKFGDGEPFTKKEWDQLLGHCMAVTDMPCIIFAKELLETYPDAKVILSVRDSPEAWQKSIAATIGKFLDEYYVHQSLYTRFIQWMQPSGQYDLFDSLNVAVSKHVPALYGTQDEMMDHYSSHNAMIKELVPEDNLLVFNAKQGWAPFCEFLGKEVPKDKPFPHMFEQKEFQGVIDGIFHLQQVTAWKTIGKYFAVGLTALGAWQYYVHGRN